MHRFLPGFARPVVLVVAAWLAGACSQQAPAPPNIVFIFSDDHSTKAIGAYGSVINETPQIDRLAREGMVFKHCFVTNAICAPKRTPVMKEPAGIAQEPAG